METQGRNAYALLEKINYVRVTGTEAEHKAAQIIVDTLADMGHSPRMERFEIDACETHVARLKVVAPFEQEYEVAGYSFCGNTDPQGLRAPFYYAEDANEIALSYAKGKIILLNSHVSTDQYKAIVSAGALGFIVISGTPVDERDKTDLSAIGLRKDRQLRNGEVAQIPGVAIRSIDALDMLKKEPTEVVLIVEQEEKKAYSHNIVVEIEGTDKKDEWLEFGAHYDSVPFSNGMYDNAAGSAIILEACRWFTANKPRRSMRFAWFGAEEIGLRGSRHHVKEYAEALLKTRLMINVDLAGQVIGGHQAVVSAEESLCGLLRFFAQDVGFGITVSQDVFSSDSSPYADQGVPAMSFYRGGTSAHNRYDIIDLISPRALEKSIVFLIEFSGRLANCEVFPIPRTIPETIQKKLATYFGRTPGGAK